MKNRKTSMVLKFGLLLVALVCGVPTRVSAQGTWSATGSMGNPHTNNQTATLLYNGKVLVVGGLGANDTTVATAELFNPATGTWSPTGSMGTPRSSHTATRLLNGKVLVTGGFDQPDCFPNCVVPIFATAEIYDPQSGTWSQTGGMMTARANHTATLLYNGKVLVAGGFSEAGVLSSAELYNPLSGTWAPVEGMDVARAHFTAVQLYNGDVLVAGGYDNDGNALASAEIYHFLIATWETAGNMHAARGFHTAARLYNGRVLVAGGLDASLPLPSGFVGLASAELYSPQTGTWTQTGSMTTPRFGHTLTHLYNGKVLAAGGEDMDISVLSSAELYNSFTGVWNPTGSLLGLRATHTATRLFSGKVLVAGGFFIGTGLTTAEFYTP